MRIGDFELNIKNKKFENSDGYVGMEHGSVYALQMFNHSNLRVNAKVKIDGKEVGAWRIKPFKGIVIERPSGDIGQFTFYRQDSPEGNKAQLLSVDSNNLGLVSVTFVPEKRSETVRVVKAARNPESLGMKSLASPGGQSMGAGGTGLSGHSNQKFVQAVDIEEDWDNAVTINLRLVEDKSSEVRPLTSVNSNPIPPPVK